MGISLPKGAYTGRSSNINAQQLQNWYANIDEQEGKEQVSLYGTPGLTAQVTIEADKEVRGAYVIATDTDVLYAVCDDDLYTVSSAYAAVDIGTLDTSTGPISIADDGDYLMITDGTSGYTYQSSTSTFAKITDVDFIGAQSCTFQDGFFLTCTGQTVQKSALNDPTSWDATEIKLASIQSDDLQAITSHNANIWCFGTDSIEVWYNAGNADFPWVNVPNAEIDMGIVSSDAFTKAQNMLFFLNNDREFCMAEGYKPKILSTTHIHDQFSKLTSVSDCRMFSFILEGNVFIRIQFPTDDKTFDYNATTGFWNAATSYKTSAVGVTTLNNRHRSNCYPQTNNGIPALFQGNHVVGDYSNGKIYTMSQTVFMDDSQTIRRVCDFPYVHDKQRRRNLVHSSFEVEFESGVGLATGQGSDPVCMLSWSDDGGHNFGSEIWASIGAIGEYGIRSTFRKLGRSDNRIYRVVLTDPVKPVIVAAYSDTRLTKKAA